MKAISIIISSCFVLAILPHCYLAMAEGQVCDDNGPIICKVETVES
ncbi:MAG: hypothetical protein J7647_31160 [Cyanobacteria bacterium SBLK]|nr:hypothetical protein [Cyanobacteria bacterium SBLK]